MKQLFSNSARTTLSANISDVATTMVVTSASAFPVITSTDYFYLTLYKGAVGSETDVEIVKVTATAGTSFTIVRAQEGTTAQNYVVLGGTINVDLRITAGGVTALLQSVSNLSELTNLTDARSNLGLGSIATQAANNVAITGGSVTGITDITVADGGTGRSTGTTAYALVATGTTATGVQQTLASGAATEVLVGGGASALPVWTTATGSGAPVRGTSPSISTPTLTNPSYSGATANAGTVTTIDINGGTIDSTTIGATTPASGKFTTLESTGNATLGDDEATDTHSIKGATTLLANSASAALTLNQLGSGNVLVVEDSASPDSTPLVIDGAGKVIVGHTAYAATAGGTVVHHLQSHSQATSVSNGFGIYNWYSGGNYRGILDFYKSASGTIGTLAAVAAGDSLGTVSWRGAGDAATWVSGASITAYVDQGTVSATSMPTYMAFSTTANGGINASENMRITESGCVLINQNILANNTIPTLYVTTGLGGYLQTAQIGVNSWAANSQAGQILFNKSRTVTPNTGTGLNDGDDLGALLFNGDDGTNFIRSSAIVGEADGATSTGNAPGRLSFRTANTGGTLVEAMQITKDGYVGIGAAPSKMLDLLANNNGITTGDPGNILRFTDVDTTSATNQPMGRIEWYSRDTDGTAGVKAYIQASASDTTPDGYLVFATANGAAAPTEAMRINAVGFASISGSFGRGAPVTKTADFTVAATENWLINNKSGSTCTVTLPTASSFTGREITIKTIQAQTVVSASSNVIHLAGGAAGTAILAATAGKWATLVSDGTNWEIMAAA